ncbi:hypothetical protein [Sphingomonas sp. Ant20]|uniref:hypothetical protein n=1 Tax=Sphingomonas sp. Ant20 TaxID=104605 RepID=UPI000AA1AC86|nr:hypothetical protein [Sphingomonas sp. Ant20]
MFIDDYILPADDDGADRGRIFAGAAIAAVLLWLAVMLWLVRGEIGAIGPVALVQLLAALCVVPALIGIIWLLAMRTSRAEAARFGVTARAMQAESARLEQAVAATAQTIDRNRRHLADQVDTLMTMGETAHQFLGAIGEGFATEIDARRAHAQPRCRGRRDADVARCPACLAAARACRDRSDGGPARTRRPFRQRACRCPRCADRRAGGPWAGGRCGGERRGAAAGRTYYPDGGDQ